MVQGPQPPEWAIRIETRMLALALNQPCSTTAAYRENQARGSHVLALDCHQLPEGPMFCWNTPLLEWYGPAQGQSPDSRRAMHWANVSLTPNLLAAQAISERVRWGNRCMILICRMGDIRKPNHEKPNIQLSIR